MRGVLLQVYYIYLFVYGLLNDTVIISVYVASNGGMWNKALVAKFDVSLTFDDKYEALRLESSC